MYWLPELSEPIRTLEMQYYELNIYKYMLFAGWEVRMVKNCDRGIFKTEVTVFHHTDRPLAGK